MSRETSSKIPAILQKHEAEILKDWMQEQMTVSPLRPDLLSESELQQQSAEFLKELRKAVAGGGLEDITTPAWESACDFLGKLARARAVQGFSTNETATFIFSLKKPLFSRLGVEYAQKPQALAEEIWNATLILDKLGLHSIESYLKGREEVISRQQAELIELSTPVVRLLPGVLAVPLIGTLDSARTQLVMESLLQEILETESSIAIIDITGVPTVDTLVAQHLLKTVSAARLMGADCIISGIRPQIAQTIVHLGVALGDVTTKASLADALELAMKRVGLTLVKAQPSN